MAFGKDQNIRVTLSGLPLTFEFEWPFHKSTSGADFDVLHGDIRIAGTELHALVAVNLSATVREILPSLEPKDAEAPVINALRKEIDRKQIEFAKSGKLLPVAFSSRHYDFKRQKWMFGKASDDVIALFIERKAYWQTKMVPPKPREGLDGAPVASGFGSREIPSPFGSGQAPRPAGESAGLPDDAGPRVWIADPTEAQYLETTPAHLLEVAARLVAADGLVRLVGEWAEASPALMAHAEKFESAMRMAIEELEKKHAFERG